jgi:hemerythrin
MALIKWSNELSVGIQEIDEQHKVLIGLLNDLDDAVRGRKAATIARAVLDKLVEYTRVHFTVEESLMRILDYPGYERHKRQHEGLTGEVNAFLQKLDREKTSVGMELLDFEMLNFLKDWLTKHIMESDRLYGPYFLEKGAKSSWSERWSRKFW